MPPAIILFAQIGALFPQTYSAMLLRYPGS